LKPKKEQLLVLNENQKCKSLTKKNTNCKLMWNNKVATTKNKTTSATSKNCTVCNFYDRAIATPIKPVTKKTANANKKV
jgi:hypothetical protein